MPKVVLTNSGIKNKLREKGFKYPSALSEYIWNSFDAEATYVEVSSICNELGGIESITVKDNGIGIIDPKSFEPIFESTKMRDSNVTKTASLPHGKYGFGRLTFSVFAEEAKWITVYKGKQSNQNYKYSISVQSNNLTDWNAFEKSETEENTGTSVIFNRIHSDISDDIEQNLSDYIKAEFAWFLELNSRKGYVIKINGKALDYSNKISLSTPLEEYFLDKYKLEIKFILWNHKLNEEYSRFYLLDSNNNEKFTGTTTLNNKGDDFFHSIYIKSDLFDNIDDLRVYENPIFENSEKGKIYKKLKKFIDSYLRDHRRPFIVKAADKLVNEFDEKGIFPPFRDDDEFDQFRKDTLHTVTKQLYQVEPKIFKSLNIDQKKIFVRLLETIMRSGEKDKIFNVLKEVLSLESAELEQLESILKSSKLSNVIKAIQLIEDRYRAVDYLKDLVFKKEYNADEPNHVQKLVEKHYWLFGEKYHLVSAEEPDFEKALQGRVDILRKYDENISGEKAEKIAIEHPSKRKQMDIFMVRQMKKDDAIHHIVVELKNPRIKLGRKQYEQVEEYMSVIQSLDRFNDPNSFWDFYLVGNDFDSSGTIENKIESASNHGEKSLVFRVKNCKIYVKRWSEIIREFELRHNFLMDKLKIERHNLITEEAKTADEIVGKSSNLTSSQPDPIVKTKKQRKNSVAK